MAYFPPNDPDFNYLKHLILVGGTSDNPWHKEDFTPYVTHLSEEEVADDWMFDTFAFWHFTSPRGGTLGADINIGTTMSGEGGFYAVPTPNPGNKRDWEALLDWYFQPGVFADALDQAISEAKQHLGSPEHKRNVVITIPYPGPYQTQFGKAEGKRLNFSVAGQNRDRATKDRLTACQWFVEETIRRFNAAEYDNLHLLGFYWTFETVYVSWDMDDHWLLKELRPFVNQKGKKLFWIPFYSTYNIHLLDHYQDYYFDCAFLQPNHMFYQAIEDVKEAALAARSRNAGIEMEFYMTLDEPIAIQNERLARFDRYLNGGIEYGYMTNSATAWFDGGKGIYQLYHHQDPQERAYYDKIYTFIRGTYKPDR